MRFSSPVVMGDQWFVNIFYRETGNPFVVRIGSNMVHVGGDINKLGQPCCSQIEMSKDASDVEIYQGARLFSVVFATTGYIPQKYLDTLGPKDEVELISPNDVAVVDDMSLAKEVVRGNDKILQQLQVAEKKRRKFYAS